LTRLSRVLDDAEVVAKPLNRRTTNSDGTLESVVEGVVRAHLVSDLQRENGLSNRNGREEKEEEKNERW
jgi:hypothetical protein